MTCTCGRLSDDHVGFEDCGKKISSPTFRAYLDEVFVRWAATAYCLIDSRRIAWVRTAKEDVNRGWRSRSKIKLCGLQRIQKVQMKSRVGRICLHSVQTPL